MMMPNGAPTVALGEHYILFQRIPLIYARIPKVANSSVKAALTRLLEQPPEEGYRTTADVMWKKGTHGETTMVDALEARRRRSSHFIFSFVRNPFDRLVSAYNNKLVENDHLSTAMQRMGLQRHMPFEAFLDVVVATPDQDLDVHLVPQSSILCVDDLPVPGFIGQMEAMPEHWQQLRVRMRQAERMEEALRARGGDATRIVLAGRNHFSASFAAGEPDGPWLKTAIDWLQHHQGGNRCSEG